VGLICIACSSVFFCLYDDGDVCKSTASMLKLSALCDAAEHHRMQPAPGPADDKLLRDGAVAALQILYCELDVLRRLKYTLETNRTSIGRTCASGARMLLADVGEHSCSCLHSKHESESSDKLCLLHPCPLPAPLACLLFGSMTQVSLTCSSVKSLSDSDTRLLSRLQVMRCIHSSVLCQNFLCHPMQG